MDIFGSTVNGTSIQTFSGPRIYASQAIPPTSGFIKQARVRLYNTGTDAATSSYAFKVHLYSDNGAGKPGTLLASSVQATASGDIETEYTVTFDETNQYNIQAGTSYFIATQVDDPGVASHAISRQNVGSKGFIYNYAYGDAPQTMPAETFLLGGPYDAYIEYEYVPAESPITASVTNSGNLASGTSLTVTLPSYVASDYLILAISSNQARTYTFGSNVVATEIGNSSNRVTAFKIVPVGLNQTSFVVTSTTAVWTWTIIKAIGVDHAASVVFSSSAAGTNTTSALETPTVPLTYIASGQELALCIAGVNATATWTTTANTIFNTTAGNAATMINAKNVEAGDISETFSTLDRGLNGTNRIENSLGMVLQSNTNGTPTLLTNGSFEIGTTIPTGWEAEGNTTIAPQYLVGTTQVSDGDKSLNIQYNGQAADDGKFFAIYQAPITGVSAGDVLELSVNVSGSLANAVMIVGIEDFLTGGTYISETDVNISGLTTTPQTFTVRHTCADNTDYIAVYFQVNEIYANANVNINIDKATLTIVPPQPNIFPNPSFENGIAGWGNYGSSIAQSSLFAHDGVNSLEVSPFEVWGGTFYLFSGEAVNVPHTFNVRIRGDALSAGRKVNAQIKNEDTNFITYSSELTLTESWQTLSVTYIPPEGAKLSVHVQGVDANVGKYYLDNIVYNGEFTVIPPSTFTWQGYEWERRNNATYGHTEPMYNGQWDVDNVPDPDLDGSLTLMLTNPTGSSPTGAEIRTTNQDFGYGTYISTIDTRLDTLHPSVVFGGMFTFDETNPPAYSEIDVHESSAWGGERAAYSVPQLMHNMWRPTLDGTTRYVEESYVQMPPDAVQTHRLIWEPGKMTVDSFIGDGVNGTLLNHSEFTNTPTPSNTRVHYNLWVFNEGPSASATPVNVKIRSFSYSTEYPISQSDFSVLVNGSWVETSPQKRNGDGTWSEIT